MLEIHQADSKEGVLEIEQHTLKLRPKTMTLSACTANVADSALCGEADSKEIEVRPLPLPRTKMNGLVSWITTFSLHPNAFALLKNF
jgi:hypothetical protein